MFTRTLGMLLTEGVMLIEIVMLPEGVMPFCSKLTIAASITVCSLRKSVSCVVAERGQVHEPSLGQLDVQFAEDAVFEHGYREVFYHAREVDTGLASRVGFASIAFEEGYQSTAAFVQRQLRLEVS